MATQKGQLYTSFNGETYNYIDNLSRQYLKNKKAIN